MTATRMVNGFLTLNFSMISYPFLFSMPQPRGKGPAADTAAPRVLLIIPIIHEAAPLAIVPKPIFNKTFLNLSLSRRLLGRFPAVFLLYFVEMRAGLCYTRMQNGILSQFQPQSRPKRAVARKYRLLTAHFSGLIRVRYDPKEECYEKSYIRPFQGQRQDLLF